jgi:hypothetical protein
MPLNDRSRHDQSLEPAALGIDGAHEQHHDRPRDAQKSMESSMLIGLPSRHEPR